MFKRRPQKAFNVKFYGIAETPPDMKQQENFRVRYAPGAEI